MADQLYEVITFTATAAGAIVALPHHIAANGVSYIPDEILKDNGDFAVISCTSTLLTVQNNGTAPASCNVLLKLWHSLTRALGPNTAVGNSVAGLTPRPFVAAAGASGGTVGQQFRYTATGAEGSDFSITLPLAQPTDVYTVDMMGAGLAVGLALDCPDILVGDRTTTQFRVVTSSAVTAGDQFDIAVF